MNASRPLLRFDSFGPAERVLHDIEVSIPHIFPEQAAGFVLTLKRMVRQYSHQYGWNTVVLTVSQGMPAEEMDNFLRFPPEHRGPLVVDPTLHNPQNNFYKDIGEMKDDSGRLRDLCACGDDTLVILYGADGISHLQSIRLLQARLCMMDMTFEMLKTDIRPDPAGPAKIGQLNTELKRIDLARNYLGQLTAVLDKSISLNLDPDGNRISGSIFELRNEVQFILSHGFDPLLRHNFEVLDLQLQNIPAQFPDLMPAPQAAAPPGPQPQLHHPDLRHNPIYSDEMNPKPKY